MIICILSVIEFAHYSTNFHDHFHNPADTRRRNDVVRRHRSAGSQIIKYCKTLNICGIKFSRFNENDILAQFDFGVYDILWLQIVQKI